MSGALAYGGCLSSPVGDHRQCGPDLRYCIVVSAREVRRVESNPGAPKGILLERRPTRSAEPLKTLSPDQPSHAGDLRRGLLGAAGRWRDISRAGLVQPLVSATMSIWGIPHADAPAGPESCTPKCECSR